ncbi:acyl-CoA N-acyltransferase [Zopfochytrium polystomum]|nr:acyl-CoA N-acyltransferase [Zopfochytrium polystomum]
MSSAYGQIVAANAYLAKLPPLPLKGVLADGSPVLIDQVTTSNTGSADIAKMQSWLNHEIKKGNTYPQEQELDDQGFRNYFLSHHAFAARSPSGEALGMFYIKPNFPGRCSHICNGGFVTSPDFRGQGVGKAMAKAFLVLAPSLGYQASMFNLVFVSNESSVRLWRSHGFREIGRIPKCGRLEGEADLVDAIMFYFDFSTLPKQAVA